jgi:hypothetical protein
VDVSRLEQCVYSTCDLVHQVYLHGNRMEGALIAVVVPATEVIERRRKALQDAQGGGPVSDAALAHALQPEVLAALVHAARQHGVVKPYEVPSAVLVELTPWTIAAGTLSAIGKLARGALDEKYRVSTCVLCGQ